ncbi:unnamed protein product [Paramecium sonneborni]|uniref:Uncharacterized protein n=1 Tax=Paramecium sonneborni TaxID=65129 RepID=A0A8S1PX97_9CILI|nr:unnamed protein product [Paramecium sonneborni]
MQFLVQLLDLVVYLNVKIQRQNHQLNIMIMQLQVDMLEIVILQKYIWLLSLDKQLKDQQQISIKSKGPALHLNLIKITLCENPMQLPPVDKPCSFRIQQQMNQRCAIEVKYLVMVINFIYRRRLYKIIC